MTRPLITNWKKFVILISFLGVTNLWADYSSLNAEEKDLVTEAFKKSRYYHYYESLVLGQDRIQIIDVKKIKETPGEGGFTKFVYGFEIDLIIDDEKFRRIAEFEFDLNQNSGQHWGLNWYSAKEVLKFAAIFIIGFFLGNAGG